MECLLSCSSVLIIERKLRKIVLFKDNFSEQHDLIIYLLFHWLKTSIYVSPLFSSVARILPSSHTFLAWFFPFGLRRVLLLMYLNVKGSQAFLFSSPHLPISYIYILLARFIVRKISSVAAITCSIQVSFFWEEGSAVITWRWMLISFLLLFFPNLAGNIVAADSRISLIAHLFTERFKLDFFVVVFGQLFSLFPHLTGKA